MKIKIKNSIRNKLIFGFLFLTISTGGSSLFVGYRIINKGIVNQTYETMKSDLRTAQYLYYNRLYQNEMAVSYMAKLDYIRNAIEARDGDFLYRKFSEIKYYLAADIVIITDSTGKVIQRVNNSRLKGDYVLNIGCIQQAIKTGKQVSGTGVLSRDILQKEGDKIAKSVIVKIIPTEKGRPVNREYEERALVLNTATPVFSGNRLAGIIYGATIINNNFEIVDRIQNLFFKKDLNDEIQVGAVTLFLDDIRVSTNVFDSDGIRTVGTQVSSEVYDRVFIKGETWLDRAFVVNKWYIAAYTPVYDTSGSICGILYVGMPYDFYNKIRTTTLRYILFISLITALLALVISLYLLKRIIRPINEVVTASEIIAEGNYSRKVRQFREYELGFLSMAFNRMIDAISERDKKIREHAQNQIVQSEKLASLGRLASGIAHEINNPLTGILTFSSMLKDELAGTVHEEDLKIIIDETLRCRKIVREVLDFARETKLEKQLVDLNSVINSTVNIIEKHSSFRNVRIRKFFAEGVPAVNVDVNQMKSVFNNLLVNAADAMPDGGEIRITTSFSYDDQLVCMTFSDNGIGIPEENLEKIFDPFFTTKDPGKGTGLGLAVIYGIIERHSGSISVKSTPGEGTEFIIKLPAGEHEPISSRNTEENSKA